jgi:hypothetical protein
VEYRIIPEGLTLEEIENANTNWSSFTAYGNYQTAYNNWVSYHTRSGDTDGIADAERLAGLVESTYDAVVQEIDVKYAVVAQGYVTLAENIAHGYYTKESSALFNATETENVLSAGGSPTLEAQVHVVLNYETDKTLLVSAPRPNFMLNEGENLRTIINLEQTIWGSQAINLKDAFNVWFEERTQANADAVNTAYAALITNGIEKALNDKKLEAQNFINDVDVYAKDFRDSLSAVITNYSEETLLEKINKTASIIAGIDNSSNHTYTARWGALTSDSGYDEYLKSLNYTMESNAAAIRAIIDDETPEYLSHPDISYSPGVGGTHINTFIGANNVVINGNILESAGGQNCWIVEVFESTAIDGIRENSSKWAYNYNDGKWSALSGNDENFIFATSGDNFHFTITIGTFDKKTYVKHTMFWNLPEGTWTELS